MNSAAHLPTRIRLLGTEYAVLAASDEVCGNVDVWSRECWVATDVASSAQGACS